MKEWLTLKRNVRFGDVDAAGVIHFHNLFRWSHEAWEESLEIFGISSHDIFPALSQNSEILNVALPIINCRANFFMPITIGEVLQLTIEPEKIDSYGFQVLIKYCRGKDIVAHSILRHMAIDSTTRKRCLLPESIELWLESSLVGGPIKPL